MRSKFNMFISIAVVALMCVFVFSVTASAVVSADRTTTQPVKKKKKKKKPRSGHAAIGDGWTEILVPPGKCSSISSTRPTAGVIYVEIIQHYPDGSTVTVFLIIRDCPKPTTQPADKKKKKTVANQPMSLND